MKMKDFGNHRPPQFLVKALRWFCDPELLEDVEGDLSELYQARASRNLALAKLLYGRDVLQLFRPGIIKKFGTHNPVNNMEMLLNHIRTAIRHAAKFKGYTAINMGSLVVGLASCMLILFWVDDELSKDQFHEKSDRMYQVWRNLVQSNGDIHTTGGIPLPLEHVLITQYPEVESVTSYTWEMEYMFRVGENSSFKKGALLLPDFSTCSVFAYS